MIDEKQSALEEFLKSLRIAYNYILLYSSQHRAFHSAVAILKEKADAATQSVNPLVIGFRPKGLTIDGKTYEKMSIHQELARMIHLRKIKSIEIRRGISEEELARLLSRIALPAQEIAQAGGAHALFKPEEAVNFTVEDLDYSVLLKGQGQEVDNPWAFLLGETSFEGADAARVEELAKDFEAKAGKLRAHMLLDDERLRESMGKFLAFLKERQPEKFIKCSRILLRNFLRDQGLQADSRAEDLKALFKGLSQEDLATILFDEMSGSETFNNHTFDLFSRLVEETMHPHVASSWAQQVNAAPSVAIAPRMHKRLRELFSFNTEAGIPTIYRNALIALDQGAMFEQEITFDRAALERSYSYVLLELFLTSEIEEDISLIVSRLIQHWPQLTEEKDKLFLHCLWDAVRVKKQSPQTAALVAGLETRLGAYVERMLWDPVQELEFASFLELLTQSGIGPEEYLRMIFEEDRYTGTMLTLYFRFFASRLQDFYEALNGRSADIDFLTKLIGTAASLDTIITLPILEHIFSCGNDIIKVEVLKAMEGLSRADMGFLCNVLSKESSFLKREALAALKKQDADLRSAIDILVGIENRWGKKNSLVLENLALIEELDLRQARRAVEALSRQRFFWHRSVRAKASQILERWNG